MEIIPFYFYIIISILTSSIITGIFFEISRRRNLQKYITKWTTYDQTLYEAIQNLKNESNLRQNIEQKLQNELHNAHKLYGQLSIYEERLKLLEHYQKKCEKLRNELNTQLHLNHTYELQLKELHIRLEEHTLTSEEKQKLLIDNENRLTIQFENLANRIFHQNESQINKQNQLSLEKILHPLHTQLNDFKNQIQSNFSKEEKNQNALTYEIRNLYQLNATITQETINLTQALKGNNKIQGNWGEVILTRALEASGMREGHEFHLQVNITQTDGRKLQPDVIVHLPHNKDIIIDSKISLTAYERYFNSNNEQHKKIAINEHINSLRTHIKSLSKKDYQKLFGLHTLDYILMFIPIESAFTLAIEKDSSLLTDALYHNIMLVSPTTLLVALRTIHNLWRYKHQNYHAQKIADKAGRLYDKLRLFMEDLNKIGQYLNKAEITYNAAKNKFSEGKGNIISQVEGFRALGVKIKQPIISNNNTTNPNSTIYLTQDIQNHPD